MKITRIIKGIGNEKAAVQIELTAEEMERAFNEMQLLKDMDDIDVIYEGAFTKLRLKTLAKIKRSIQDDDNGIGWREAVEEAINQCGYREFIEAYQRRA